LVPGLEEQFAEALRLAWVRMVALMMWSASVRRLYL
jgi:hypothetical protein